MLASFKNWLAMPFNGNMSAARWFAFVGLLLVIIVLWQIILRHMSEL